MHFYLRYLITNCLAFGAFEETRLNLIIKQKCSKKMLRLLFTCDVFDKEALLLCSGGKKVYSFLTSYLNVPAALEKLCIVWIITLPLIFFLGIERTWTTLVAFPYLFYYMGIKNKNQTSQFEYTIAVSLSYVEIILTAPHLPTEKYRRFFLNY